MTNESTEPSVGRLDAARDAIKAAYEAGCHAVHENYEAYRDPDFGEAASDYAADVEDVIEAIAGVDIPACNIPPEGWYCTRSAGHSGPCAAMRKSPQPATSREAVADVCAACHGARDDLARGREPEELCDPCYDDAMRSALTPTPVAGVAIPDGYALVPIEPTKEMIPKGIIWLMQWQYMRKQDRENAVTEAYKAMIAEALRAAQVRGSGS